MPAPRTSTQEPQTPPLPPLPALREDLRLLPSRPGKDGAPRYLLHDPLAGRFHELDERAFALLAAWQPVSPPELLARLGEVAEDHEFDIGDLEEMSAFLFAHKLTTTPPGLDTDTLVAQEQAAHPPLYKQIVHKYLFFRIPLFRPQKFLQATYPFIAPLFTRGFAAFVILCGLAGLFMAVQQWDSFKTTFLHFLTFEGLIYYGLTLVLVKSLHELGHAYMAHRLGVKVPTIGVAFLVMFPILYTDTTDAWRLRDPKKRALIDAAGIMVELSLAALALFAWSFLPDGPARSAAFFIATTSWVMSLAVNLSPFMRFDGYYLLMDLFDQRNMQDRGIALARWHLRKTLFGLDHPVPVETDDRTRLWLTLYAYGLWIYRFNLFLGIAILVHYMFPRALGIILFSVEIGFFLALPIGRELLTWWRLRMEIFRHKRSLLTLSGTVGLMALLFVPWQSNVRTPAVLRPALKTDLFPSVPGRVERVLIRDGARVKEGQLLIKLSSDALKSDMRQTRLRIALLKTQLASIAGDTQNRTNAAVLQSALKREQVRLEGLERQSADLLIRAPYAGQILELSPELHPGRTVNPRFRLARLARPGRAEILAFGKEADIVRLQTGAQARFIPDQLLQKSLPAHVQNIAATAQDRLEVPLLSSAYRGPVAVEPDPDGSHIPTQAITRIKAVPDTPMTPERAIRGVLIIKGKKQSPARAIGRQIARVLLREADF